MNRFTALILLFSCCCITSLHAQSPFQNPNQPHCASDEWQQQMAAQHPDFAKELEKYFAEAVPQLAQAEKTLEPLLTISVVVHIIHNGEPVGQGQNLFHTIFQQWIISLGCIHLLFFLS